MNSGPIRDSVSRKAAWAGLMVLACMLVPAAAPQPDPLSPEQRAWLDEHGPIVVGVTDSAAPGSFLDNGTYRGWDVELMQLAALKAGLDVEFVGGADNAAQAVARLRADEVDATGSWGDRQDLQDFAVRAGDWGAVSFIVLTRDPDVLSIDDLEGRISAPSGSPAQERIEEDHPHLTFIETTNAAEGVEELMAGGLEAYVAPVGAAGNLLHAYRGAGLRALVEPLTEIPVGYWVRGEDVVLASILETAAGLITPEEAAIIQLKWTGIQPPAAVQERTSVPAWALALGGTLALAIIGAVVFTIVLRRQVQVRTTELAELNASLDERVRQRTMQLDAARFRTMQLLHSAGEGITGLDAEGRVTFCNPAGVKMLGHRFEVDMFRRPHHEMFHHTRSDGSPYDAADCPIQEALEGGERRHITGEVFCRADGSTFPVDYTVTPITLEGEVSGAVVVFRDVRRRLAQEQALKESEEAFRSMAESAVDAIIAADDEGTITYANAAAGTMFRTETERLVGAPLTALMPQGQTDAHREAFQRYVDTGQGNIVGHTVEFEARRMDGTLFPVAISLSAARRQGRLQFTALMRDLTHDKAREERLQQSNRDLEAYASMASHDLQAPLRQVRGFADILARQADRLDGEGRMFLDRIDQSVGRMQDIIDSLLAYSRLSSRPPDVGDVRLTEVVAEAADVAQQQLDEIDASLTVEDLPTVRGDRHRLYQVFQNLIQNSIRYRHPDRPLHIAISYDAPDSMHRITVADNGQGFEDQYAERMFGMFQRLHERSAAGVGLGLPIVKRTVEQHGGRIHAEGRPDEGATFIIELPMVPP